MEGWIALYRSITEHWVWQDDKIFKRWIDLILQASYEDCKVIFHGAVVKLKRGQMVTSKRRLLHRWQTNGTVVKNLLELFEKEEMIKMVKIGNFTIITILNYDKFQLKNDKNEEDSEGNQSHKKEHFPSHDKKYKNINNKNITHFGNRNFDFENEKGFFEKLENEEQFWRETEDTLKMDGKSMHKKHLSFFTHQKNKERAHENYNDYKRHFYDWLIKILQNGDREKQTDKYAARRGTDIEDKKSTDYGGAF